VGPSVAGLFLAIAAGPVLAYAVNALLFCAGWATVGMLHVPAIVRQGARPSMLRLMGEGLGFMRATPVVLFLLLLDFFATFFTAYDALLPVFAREVLGVGAEGFGVLASAPSIGAFVGSATILVFFGRVERRGRAVLVAVFLYGLAILAFSVSSAFALSLVALMAAGMLDQTAVAMRNSTLLLLTPNELRGRVESIRIMFIQGGPTLGGVQAGALAGAIGPGLTLALESGMVLVTVLVIHLRVRDLWRLRIR
jgi:MFS family permease